MKRTKVEELWVQEMMPLKRIDEEMPKELMRMLKSCLKELKRGGGRREFTVLLRVTGLTD